MARPSRSSDEAHLDLALVMELAALGDRPHHERQILDRAGREGEAVRRRREAGGVGDGGALDGGLGAVEEGIEHLGIEAAALGLLLVEAPVLPHRLGRRLREVRQPLVAAAGRRHREARGARPVDQLADQRRLVAVGQAIDHAGLGRAARRAAGRRRRRPRPSPSPRSCRCGRLRAHARRRRSDRRSIRPRRRSRDGETSARQSSVRKVLPLRARLGERAGRR